VFCMYVHQHHLLVLDVCSVVPVVAELEERIRKGQKVYLHWCALGCRGGFLISAITMCLQ
jgi:hypothetical protein